MPKNCVADLVSPLIDVVALLNSFLRMYEETQCAIHQVCCTLFIGLRWQAWYIWFPCWRDLNDIIFVSKHHLVQSKVIAEFDLKLYSFDGHQK